MKIFYLKFILIILFVSFFTSLSIAQRSNGLAVEGKISVEEGSVEGAIIQMYQDGRRLDNYGVDADGRYKVELNYNHKFELIFELQNNFSQKIAIETAVPSTVLQSDPKFPPFPINVNLFTEIPGIDKSFSEKTVLKIYYNPNVDNFISELYYNDAQIKKLIDQAIAQSKIIGKESDYLSKLTRAEIAELRREYNQLLEQAGNEYNNEKFLAALDGFKAASIIFPSEQFPKDRIAEINDLLGLIMAASELDKAKAERFAALVKEADLLFNQTKYSDARNSYNRALSIRPTDNYALGQVKKIIDLLKNEQVETQYRELIAQGDNSFREILYNEAIKKYEEALQLKANESYPKNKIEEINGILADQAKDLEKQADYKQAIFQAESMFERQFYEKSLASYQNALNYKPGDPLATQKIEEIRGIMHEIANRIQFDDFVKNADKSYKKKLYPEALNDYKEAFVLFPDEPYPKQRIDEINQILDLKENFADLVYKADNQFIAENYDASKSLYQQALKIRSSDKYSLDRVREIDGLLTVLGVDAQYNSLLAEADDLFNANNYENAKGKYTEALGVKPKEKYPKDKVAEINSILQQIAKTNQQYQQAITKADGLFQQQEYIKAKTAFADAGQIKPDEIYPPEMIGKINGLVAEQTRILAEQQASEKVRLAAESVVEQVRLAEAAAAEAARLAALQAEKDKNYTDAIARADNLFDETNYENARNEYRSALSIKPEETYPQQRIDEIGTLMAQLSAALKEQELLDKNYENLIQQADRFFGSSNYGQAKGKYENALELKADETYPKEKIIEIGQILQQQKLDEEYRAIILVADGFFKTDNYLQAKGEYEKALAVNPVEQYPKNQIVKIDDILQKEQQRILAEKQAAENLQRRTDEIAQMNNVIAARDVESEEGLTSLYNEFIQRADALFNGKQYNIARAWYYQAFDVKPEEMYPPQRIAEINRLIGGLLLSQLDRDYQGFIDLADSTFRDNQLAVARGWYNRALSVKGNEVYPKNQITEIQNKITERIAGQSGQQFENNVEKASKASEAQAYNVARFWYKKALELRPNDEAVKSRLQEIQDLLK